MIRTFQTSLISVLILRSHQSIRPWNFWGFQGRSPLTDEADYHWNVPNRHFCLSPLSHFLLFNCGITTWWNHRNKLEHRLDSYSTFLVLYVSGSPTPGPRACTSPWVTWYRADTDTINHLNLNFIWQTVAQKRLETAALHDVSVGTRTQTQTHNTHTHTLVYRPIIISSSKASKAIRRFIVRVALYLFLLKLKMKVKLYFKDNEQINQPDSAAICTGSINKQGFRRQWIRPVDHHPVHEFYYYLI